MTEREKRSARKRWRLYKQQVRAKQKKVSENKSPPKSPSSACSSHQKLSSKKKKNREEAKCYRENKLLKEKIVNLEKKHAIYRKRLQRAKEQSSNDALKGNVLTPRSKTRKLLRNFSKKEVKRALLFHNALIDQLRLAHKLRPAVSPVPGILSGSIIRKYKLKSVAMRSCGIHTRNKLLQRSSLSRRMYKIVQEFYERDDVSRITAGMKNTVTKKKSKKQRRILCDSLQNLHQKYLSENPPMSYSTFCRLRPFWVLFPSERDRNTCQCKLCENTNFMFRALKNANVLEAQSLDELLEGREWNYDKKKRNDEIQWEEWTTKSEKREIKRGNKFERKNVTFTVKETFSNNVSNLVDKFDNQIKRYRSHSINIKNQYRYYKERKENLEENSCLLHIDFSENYVCKLSNEIQSMHFGASKKQLSLHTGIFYIGKNEKQTFATVSESLAHNPGAIWAHLRPILLNIRQSSDVEKIYIFSDGPTTQYRQKCNFFMFSTELHKLGFSYAEWNFFESGHGKGIPDAVGGSLKRKADSKVKFGCDITSAKTFVDSVAGGKLMLVL